MSINRNDKEEFIGQIIDLFEDFLDEKSVKISNPEAVRGLSITSGHFVSFGRLGLVRGRLIRLAH